MKINRFDYRLPKHLIAQKPVRPRDRSRLLVVRAGENRFEHRGFFEIGKILRPGDVLVLNDSKVIPARIIGKKPSGGKTEILLIKDLKNGLWQVLIKNLRTSQDLKFGGKNELTGRPVENLGNGLWKIKFNIAGEKFGKIIRKIGRAPTPPYIKRLARPEEYQTVYARRAGSAAAPTAGLHFTKRLLASLKKSGVEILFVTLHVGPGTFQPVKTGDIKKHKIHSEFAVMPAGTARRINRAKKEGRRIIAVGTTACRTLESFTDKRGIVGAGQKEVDLFIIPGYKFRAVDGLITNFHLPKTTLLFLVSAFLGDKEKNQTAGRKKLFRAYREAIKKNYRFYSFGDAMMIII